jgi:protein-S-isoprenylcysteine O-methyltransferase Ste14
MSALELRIPPDVVWLAVAALMWVASALTPGVDVTIPLRVAASGLLIAVGIALVVAARVRLSRAHTTWHPTEPGETTSLVTDGVYRVSRNPVYLGMLVALIGWSVVLASLPALALTALFVVYLDRFQIRPEEHALSAIMGAEYREYASRVRRWL